MNLAPGDTLGAYRIVAPLGRGGMATVYKAYQPGLSRYVAIKILPASLAEESGFHERFKQEAVAIARLRHPNILTIFEYGEAQGLPYLVMEYVDGGELSQQLGVPLPVSYVVSMLAPIAAALDYAHASGILHRDVKPSNILLHHGGKPVLADFGIAKLVDSGQRLTRTGAVLGTPEYMAPEQALAQPFVAASDQYALAIVAYEMLTGRVPFTADTPVAILLAHLQQPLPPPRSLNPALSAELEAALLRGLAKRREDRYPSVLAFAAALAAAGRVPLDTRTLAAPADALPAGPSSAVPGVAAARLHPNQAPAWFALGIPLYLPFLVLLLLVLAALTGFVPATPFSWLPAALVIAVALLANLGAAGALGGVLTFAAGQRARGLAADTSAVYRALGWRLLALLGDSLLASTLLLLLTLSVAGLPLACLFGLDWSLAGPVAVKEQRRGWAALRRSADLVGASRPRILTTLLPIVVGGVLLAILLRAIAGQLFAAAPAALLAIGLAGLVAVPCLSGPIAYLYAAVGAPFEEGGSATPAAPPAAPRAGAEGAAWQWPRS